MSSAVVVGAGVFGASTARELDRRGWDVTLVEQYTPGNARSGSGGDTRLLRVSHAAVDWYAPLALEAVSRARRVADLTPRRLLLRRRRQLDERSGLLRVRRPVLRSRRAERHGHEDRARRPRSRHRPGLTRARSRSSDGSARTR